MGRSPFSGKVMNVFGLKNPLLQTFRANRASVDASLNGSTWGAIFLIIRRKRMQASLQNYFSGTLLRKNPI